MILSEADKRRFAPFCHRPDRESTPLRLFGTAVASVTLLPLRVIALLVAFALSWLVVSVTSNSRVRFACSVVLSRAIRVALGFWTVELRGREHLVRDGITVVSNHVSIVEIFVLHELFAPAFVAKAGVRRIPFVGTIVARLGGIFVERDVARQDTKSTPSAAELISRRQSLHPFPSADVSALAVFSEGTTSNGEFVLKFHTGAFRVGAPVLPVAFDFSRNRWFSPAFETIPLHVFLFRLLTQWRSFLTVTILPVRVPSAAEIADPALHARSVQHLIARHLGVPAVESSLSDKLELHSRILSGEFAWQDVHGLMTARSVKESETASSTDSKTKKT